MRKYLKSTSKSTEVGEKSEWNATWLLNSSDNNMSTMKESKLNEVKMLFDTDVNVVVPKSTEGANWYCGDWTCFYYHPFETCMRFPFSKLVEDLLIMLNVSPTQLMSSTWKILACLDTIEEKNHLGVGIGVVCHSYTTKKFNGCRFGLVIKKR